MTTNQPPGAAVTEAIDAGLIDAEPIGVILAGGKSSRMGRDKATLEIAGEPLLLRARKVLLAAGCSRVLLSGAPRPNWPRDVIADLTPDAGPVGGIVSAVRSISANAASPLTLLFIPVDTPLLSPALLQGMIDSTHGYDGCTIEDAPLPLALRSTKDVLKQCASILPDLLEGKSVSVRRFLQPLTLVRQPQSDAIKPLLMNVNTPTEWESLNRELENRT